MKQFIVVVALLCSSLSLHAEDAPFLAAFHGLSVSKLMAGKDYYPSRGQHAQTLSIYFTNVNTFGLLTAGTFDSLAPSDSPMQIRIYRDDIVDFFKAHAAEGYLPREISATNADEIPIFNVIWEKSPYPGALFVDMNDAGFDARYKEYVVEKGYRIAEHVVYTTKAGPQPRKRWHMAVFKKDGQGFYFHHSINVSTFNNLSDHYRLMGYYPSSISVSPITEGETLSVIYTFTTSTPVFLPAMTAKEYQDQWTLQNNRGFRLMRVVGYHRGELFAGIWQKR